MRAIPTGGLLDESPSARFSFHLVADCRPPSWPREHGNQHAHFDLRVDDLHDASLAVERAGARPLAVVVGPGS
ncbi:VOC family protein [Nocardioides aurantiacus]|uniref:VOC family protein n=1 Tax=Nocardioides aurantiacus TaxID=86796 RepID=UPI001B864E51